MRLVLLLFFIVFLNAEEISKYDVIVKIENDGKLDITENILYDFGNNQKHGIFRNIPLNNNKIDLISINQDNKSANYKILYENNDVVYKIGDANILLSGKHLYKIHYTIDRAVFKKDDKLNAISLNVIGTGWKVPIKNITIDIYLPSKLSNAEFKLFVGNKGSTTEYPYTKLSSTHYKIEKKFLSPHQGITFDLYFDKNLIKTKNLSNNIAILFLIIFTIGLYIYYSKHKIPYIATSPQYYPPKDLDILQAGLLIDQVADNKDFSSAILELATKGYLKINVTKEKLLGIFNSETIILEKLKEAEGLQYSQLSLFSALFANEDRFILGQEDVKIARRLKNMVSKVNNWLYEWSVKEKYMKENPKKARIFFIIKTGLVAMIGIIIALFQMVNFYGDMAIFELVPVIFMIIGIILFCQDGIVIKIFALSFIGMSLIFLLANNIPLLNPLTISILTIIPIMIFSKKISNYSIKGIRKLKYLLGLKEFILRVEKQKLEYLIKENPNYLDEMLPYAVLFGAKHWFSFYNEFNVNTNWYEGDSIYFYRLSDDLYKSFNTTANYTESNGSNSFSGGGSVGGGSGGGGGGSW